MSEDLKCINKFCEAPCRYGYMCRLSEEQTRKCRAKGYQFNKVVGLDWSEIEAMQQKKGRYGK